jgi:hypothetical protein
MRRPTRGWMRRVSAGARLSIHLSPLCLCASVSLWFNLLSCFPSLPSPRRILCATHRALFRLEDGHCLVSVAARCECFRRRPRYYPDLVVPEANDAIAFALQPRCALGIGGIHRSAESEALTRASAPHRLNVCAAGGISTHVGQGALSFPVMAGRSPGHPRGGPQSCASPNRASPWSEPTGITPAGRRGWPGQARP